MVSSENFTEEESDCVEEMAKRDPWVVPERYIVSKEHRAKDEETLAYSAEIPVIDLALLSNGQKEELKKLDAACKDWGFFLVSCLGFSSF